MRLVTPAARSRWPRLVLTEPIRHGRLPSRKTCCSAASLGGVAERGAGAVRLDVVDVGGVHVGARPAPRPSPRPGPRTPGAVKPTLRRAVVVDRPAAQDGVYPGRRRRARPPAAAARPRRRRCRRGAGAPASKAPALAVGRRDPALLVEVADVLRHADRDAAGQRDVAFARPGSVAAGADRDQRRSSRRSARRTPGRTGPACRRRGWRGSPCRWRARARARPWPRRCRWAAGCAAGTSCARRRRRRRSGRRSAPGRSRRPPAPRRRAPGTAAAAGRGSAPPSG